VNCFGLKRKKNTLIKIKFLIFPQALLPGAVLMNKFSEISLRAKYFANTSSNKVIPDNKSSAAAKPLRWWTCGDAN
jgi:hypothetical protein